MTSPDAVPSGQLWNIQEGDPEVREYWQSRFISMWDDLPLDEMIDGLVWPSGSTVVDLGGGTGFVLGKILERVPDIKKGILVDLAGPISGSGVHLSSHNNRAETFVADFLRDPLPEADIFTLFRTLHNWQDELATELLSNARRSANDSTVLRIGDVLMNENGQGPPFALMQAQRMQEMFGSTQHTFSHLSRLLIQSGWYPISEPIIFHENLAVVEASTK